MRFKTDVLSLDEECWLWSCEESTTCDHRFYRKTPGDRANIACFSRINYEYDISKAKKIVIVFDTDYVRGACKAVAFVLSLAGKVAFKRRFSSYSELEYVCNEDKSLIVNGNDSLSWWVDIVEEF